MHHALSSHLLFPLQILFLLASNAIPHCHSHPHSFALFLPFLSQHAFSFRPTPSLSCNCNYVDSVLWISETNKVRDLEIGHVFMLFFYEIVISLLDCMLIDWGFQVTFTEKSSLVATGLKKFNCLQQRLQFLESLELASSELKLVNQVLTKVSANMHQLSRFDYSLSKHRLVGTLINMGSCKIPLRCNYRFCQSPCWVPIDIYMENVMDSRQIPTKSAINVLTEGIKTLQMLNRLAGKKLL